MHTLFHKDTFIAKLRIQYQKNQEFFKYQLSSKLGSLIIYRMSLF